MFSNVNKSFKGTTFDAVEAVKENVIETMNMHSENDLKHCLKNGKFEWKGVGIELDRILKGNIEGISGESCKRKSYTKNPVIV